MQSYTLKKIPIGVEIHSAPMSLPACAPQGAGLGIEVDEDFARANPFDGVGLHLQMQDDPCEYQSQNSFLGGAPPRKV